MAYCPQCLTEYREDAPECMDCRVPLQPGPPPPPAIEPDEPKVDLVRVRTFSGPTASMDAQLAQNILQSEGISSAVPGETSTEILPGVDAVQLLVRAEDAAEAAEILEGFLDNPTGVAAEEEEE